MFGPTKTFYKRFSRNVTAAMLVDENKRFVIRFFCSFTRSGTFLYSVWCLSRLVEKALPVCLRRMERVDKRRTSHESNSTTNLKICLITSIFCFLHLVRRSRSSFKVLTLEDINFFGYLRVSCCSNPPQLPNHPSITFLQLLQALVRRWQNNFRTETFLKGVSSDQKPCFTWAGKCHKTLNKLDALCA